MKTTCARPYPLGATLDPNGCNFAVYAPANKDLLLALFNPDGSYETHPLAGEYAGIKYTYVEGIKAGKKYGFIIHHQDELLYLSDPYAKALDNSLTYEVPFKTASSFDLAKCVVTNTDFDWQDTVNPERPREEMVLFETHVKGVTKLHPDIAKICKALISA